VLKQPKRLNLRRDGKQIGTIENITVGTQALLDLAQEGLG
jgi:hypothetical protein